MRFGCKEMTRVVFATLLASVVALAGSPICAADAETDSRKVTLQFQGMDILEVLKILSQQTGINMVAGRNVSGRVTLFVKEADPWEVFEVVLAANELAYERTGQTLTIMAQRDYEALHGVPYQDRRIIKTVIPRHAKTADLSRTLAQVKSNIGRVIADEATNSLILMDTPPLVAQMEELVQRLDQPMETRIFQLSYGSAKDVAPIAQGMLTQGIGTVAVDERTNQLAVTDYPDKLEKVARITQAFDERSTQVLIEAKIIQVTLSDKFQLGIDWQVLAQDKITLKGLGALNLTSGGVLNIATASLSQAGDYKALVEALRTFGETKILSEPRLTVVNNQEAKILVGSKEPFVTRSVSQTGTGTAVTAESVTFLDVGVKLFVTPTITRDRFVQIKVRPEVSSKTGTLTTSEKNEIPIIETAEVETVLLVEDGGTVILGGLIKDENSTDQRRIPLLGDIPVLGAAFRNSKQTMKKTELVVFLTPHIVTGERAPAAAPPGPFRQSAGWEDYYGWMMDLIQGIAQAQEPLAKSGGIVVVEFTILPDGRLKGKPRVVSSGSRKLDSLAKRAVIAASPFPPLPEPAKGPKTFKVPISYPERAGS